MTELTQFDKNVNWLVENLIQETNDIKRAFHINSIKLIYEKYRKGGFALAEILDFFHKAQLSGADPRKNEVYLVGFEGNCQIVYSYHFLLGQANATGKLTGVSCSCDVEEIFNPVYNEVKKQLVATAIVYREGNTAPSEFKAIWSEFVKTKKAGGITKSWASKPRVMLQKCAISNALRWSFPEALSGVFIEDEMPVISDNGKERKKTSEDISNSILSADKPLLGIEVVDVTTTQIQPSMNNGEQQEKREVKNSTFRIGEN